MDPDRSRRRAGLAGIALLAALLAWWMLRVPASDPPAARLPHTTPAPVPAGRVAPPVAAAAGPDVQAPAPAAPVERPEPDPPLPDTLTCAVQLPGAPPGRSRMVERMTGPVPENVWAKIRVPGGMTGTVGLLDEDGLALRTHGNEILGGTVYADGHIPADFVVEDGSCQPITLERAARIEGVVLGLDGRSAGVEGCGGEAGVEDDGTFVLDAAPGPCRVRAATAEDGIGFYGPEVELIPALDVVTRVELQAP